MKSIKEKLLVKAVPTPTKHWATGMSQWELRVAVSSNLFPLATILYHRLPNEIYK